MLLPGCGFIKSALFTIRTLSGIGGGSETPSSKYFISISPVDDDEDNDTGVFAAFSAVGDGREAFAFFDVLRTFFVPFSGFSRVKGSMFSLLCSLA